MRRRTVPAGLAVLALIASGAVVVGSRLGADPAAVDWLAAPVAEAAPALAEPATDGEATVAQFGVVVPEEVVDVVDPATPATADDVDAVTQVDDVLTERPEAPALAAEAVTSDGDDIALDVVDDAARAASAVIEVAEPFVSLGFTWPLGASATPSLQARVRHEGGAWSEWFTLEAGDWAPDADAGGDGELRASTDPLWVDSADAVQIASLGDAADAVPIDDVRLVTVSVPEEEPTATLAAATGQASLVSAVFADQPVATGADETAGGVASMAAASAPAVITRAQWGARAPRCTGSAGRTWGAAPKLQAAVVHHTAGSNSYTSRDEAMRRLRADQAYHMDANGWCDIGYNFVVDKFGNIYEGAAGSLTAPIIGAHAAPFNTGTVGISVLGCYGNCSSAIGNAAMPDAAVNAVGRIAGWRLGAYGVNPNATIQFATSSAKRTMPAIVGHRDVNSTACPGANGYARLGDIRRVAAAYAAQPPAPAPTPTPTPTPTAPRLEYRAHVQNVGWQGWVTDGVTAGTSGRSLRVEALQFRLAAGSPVPGGIECSAHVQNLGWTGFAGTGQTCGTSGRSLRVEALRLRLTGELAARYDVWYRVHVQNLGWLGWARNGADAGSAGLALRNEAVEVRLVAKGAAGPAPQTGAFAQVGLSVTPHVAKLGWLPAVGSGQTAGTSGRSLGLEAVRVAATLPWPGQVECRAHVQNIGWTGWVGSGALCGTTGRALRQEAIALRITGTADRHLDIWYRVHVQNVGWMGWARDGALAGTAGYSQRVEAVEVVVVPQGGPAPGPTARAYLSR